MVTGGSQCVVNGLTHYERNRQQYIDAAADRKSRNRDYVRQIKMNAQCADCGLADWRVLDFDHLPGTVKERGIAKVLGGWSIARIEREIAKCEIVCANCHRIRTLERAGIA